LRDQVTQFNNTQNVVKVSDFRSNDTVQEHLKEQFKKIVYRGRQVAYVPKRTDRPPKNAELIRLEEFAKSIYAFMEEPISFSGATAFLFDDLSGGYNRIFGDGEVKWEKMPDDEFRLRAAIYWLSKELGTHMREDRAGETDPDTKAALERKWVLMYATRKVFEHYFPNGKWKDELRKTYKGDWTLGEDNKGKLFLQIYNTAKAGVVTAYRNSKKHDPEFVHRNWMRRKETPGGNCRGPREHHFSYLAAPRSAICKLENPAKRFAVVSPPPGRSHADFAPLRSIAPTLMLPHARSPMAGARHCWRSNGRLAHQRFLGGRQFAAVVAARE
jgi:AIPR protein